MVFAICYSFNMILVSSNMLSNNLNLICSNLVFNDLISVFDNTTLVSKDGALTYAVVVTSFVYKLEA